MANLDKPSRRRENHRESESFLHAKQADYVRIPEVLLKLKNFILTT